MILNWFSFGSRAHFSHCQHCSMRQVAFLTFHNWFFRSLGSAWWKKGSACVRGSQCPSEVWPKSKRWGQDRGTTRHNSVRLWWHVELQWPKPVFTATLSSSPGSTWRRAEMNPLSHCGTNCHNIILYHTAKYCKIHWTCQQKRRTFDLFWSILSFCNSPAHSQYLADYQHVLRKMVRRRFMHPQM